MTDLFPCTGLGKLFFGEPHELKYPSSSSPHKSAIELCQMCDHQQYCAAQGVAEGDTHTVRAGQRTWIRDERKKLAEIAKGDPHERYPQAR